jgi:hypothetical protein
MPLQEVNEVKNGPDVERVILQSRRGLSGTGVAGNNITMYTLLCNKIKHSKYCKFKRDNEIPSKNFVM